MSGLKDAFRKGKKEAEKILDDLENPPRGFTIRKRRTKMETERFVAPEKSGDLKGTAAADRSDSNAAEDWLEEKDLKKPDEFLVGILAGFYENRGTHVDSIGVTFLITTGSHDSVKDKINRGERIFVRKESTDMKLTEFFGLFKVFNVAISPNGILTEYTIQDDGPM